MYNLSYSGILYVESHADILDYCARSGEPVEKFNRCVRFEPTTINCKSMFANMRSFNHSVIFPHSVQNVDYAFIGCNAFKQYIFIDYDLFDSIKHPTKVLGLADAFPANRIIVTNSSNSFDIYFGTNATYPPSVPGIIQLMRNESQDEMLDCMMFLRSLPEFKFTVKNVYVSADSPVFLIKILEMLDAAISVNQEMFTDTKYRFLSNADKLFMVNQQLFPHLAEAVVRELNRGGKI